MSERRSAPFHRPAEARLWRALAESTAIAAVTMVVAWAITSTGEFRSVPIMFLPAVLYAAIVWGRLAGALVAILSVVLFNYFFMAPFNAFGIATLEDLMTIAVFLGVALIAASLARRAREQARTAEAERFGTALLGSISHDFRTPLSTILGAATTLLSATALPEAERRSLLRGIRDEALRLDRFITNLLDMTRLRSERLRPNLQRLDLADVVAGAVGRLRQRLAEHELAVESAPEAPLVAIDPVLIEHSLVNLLDNAARHTPKGGRITVETRSEAGRMVVTVEDEGPGVAAPDRARIFEPFFSTDPAGANQRTGIGLAIAKSFVEAHGGTLTVDDSRSGGARFTIALPC